jgi:hypothetical protein
MLDSLCAGAKQWSRVSAIDGKSSNLNTIRRALSAEAALLIWALANYPNHPDNDQKSDAN